MTTKHKSYEDKIKLTFKLIMSFFLSVQEIASFCLLIL